MPVVEPAHEASTPEQPKREGANSLVATTGRFPFLWFRRLLGKRGRPVETEFVLGPSAAWVIVTLFALIAAALELELPEFWRLPRWFP